MDRIRKQWLQNDALPANVYQLLGQPCLHPDRRVLLTAVHTTTSFLSQSENLPSPKIAERARRLERLLADAKHHFSDESRWHAYENQLLDKMREEYAAQHSGPPDSWKLQELRRWLQTVHHVHRARLDTAAMCICSPDCTGPQHLELQTEAGLIESNQLSARGYRYSGATTPTLPSSSDQAPKKTPHSQTGPTPPPSPLHKRPPPSPLQIRGRSTDSGLGQQTNSSNSGALWIFGSAVVTAIVVGLLGVLFVLPVMFPSEDRTAAVSSPSDDVKSVDRPARDMPSGTNALKSGSASKTREDPGDNNDRAPGSGDEGREENNNPVEKGRSQDGKKIDGGDDTEDSGSNAKPPTKVEGMELIFERFHGDRLLVLAWSKNGSQLAVAGEGAKIDVWNVVTGQKAAALKGHMDFIYDLDWNHGATPSLASASDDGTVRIWDVKKAREVAKLSDGSSHAVRCLSWFGATDLLAAGNKNGGITIWDTRNRSIKRKFDFGESAGPVRSMRWFKNLDDRALTQAVRNFVAVGHMDGSVLFWDIDNSDRPLTAMLLPESGDILTNLQADKKSGNSRFKQGRIVPHLREGFFDVAVSPTQPRFAVAGGNLDIWESTNQLTHRIRVLPGRRGNKGYRAVAWASDGTRVAAGDGSGEIDVWETTRWKLVFRTSYSAPVNGVRFDPQNGRRLAVAYDDGRLAIYNVDLKNKVPVPSLSFDPEKVFEKAREFLANEDWANLAAARSLLQMHRLSSPQRDNDDRLMREFKAEAKVILDRLESEGDGLESLPRWNPQVISHLLELQEIVDVAPESEVASRARKLIEKIYDVK